MSTLYRSILQGISVGPARGPTPPQDPLCVGHFDAKLAKFGFRGGSKRENDVNRSPTLKKWRPPSQDSLRKLKKWRPPWRFLFS